MGQLIDKRINMGIKQYMAGIKDAVRMFTYLGLLKDIKISEQGENDAENH